VPRSPLFREHKTPTAPAAASQLCSASLDHLQLSPSAKIGQLLCIPCNCGYALEDDATEEDKKQAAPWSFNPAKMAAAAFGGDTPFTEHGDVLSADPQDAQGKAALVEELKSRARGAFTAKNYPVAERLYSKGLQVQPDAALYANRSATRVGLGRHEAALDDAELALKADPTYVKVLLLYPILLQCLVHSKRMSYTYRCVCRHSIN
jgi:tetratricopeptide (TPR) repeat protein